MRLKQGFYPAVSRVYSRGEHYGNRLADMPKSNSCAGISKINTLLMLLAINAWARGVLFYVVPP